MKKRFKEMLLKHQSLDMASQRTAFNNIIEEWIHHAPTDPQAQKMHAEQIDDIILVGVRI